MARLRIPGIYLVGRDDNAVAPLLVKIRGGEYGADDTPGWWWRRMRVPRYLPTDEELAAMPEPNRDPRGPDAG